MKKRINPRTSAPNPEQLEADLALHDAYAQLVEQDKDRVDWALKAAVFDLNEPALAHWEALASWERDAYERPQTQYPKHWQRFRDAMMAELEATRLERARALTEDSSSEVADDGR